MNARICVYVPCPAHTHMQRAEAACWLCSGINSPRWELSDEAWPLHTNYEYICCIVHRERTSSGLKRVKTGRKDASWQRPWHSVVFWPLPLSLATPHNVTAPVSTDGTCVHNAWLSECHSAGGSLLSTASPSVCEKGQTRGGWSGSPRHHGTTWLDASRTLQ